MAIHDVDVKQGTAAIERRLGISGEPGKVRGQDRRCDFNSHIRSGPPSLPGEKRLYAEVLRSSPKNGGRAQARGLPRNRTAFMTARTRELQQTHDVERPFRGDGQLCEAENRVAHIHVVIAIVTRCRWNAPVFERVSYGNR